MSCIQGADCDQLCLPTCLEDMISADNPVRVIDAFVDMPDMEALGFSKHKPAYTGRPAYNPKDLLKLYLYGHFFSIRSSYDMSEDIAIDGFKFRAANANKNRSISLQR